MVKKVKTSAERNRYRWEWEEFKYLVHLLSKTNNFEEVLNLFIDLHATKEIAEIIRRSIISSYLVSGKTYEEISELTGASSNTISKITSKLCRKKEILSKLLKEAGSFEEFQKKNFDKKDCLQELIKRTKKRLVFSSE